MLQESPQTLTWISIFKMNVKVSRSLIAPHACAASVDCGTILLEQIIIRGNLLLRKEPPPGVAAVRYR